MPWHVKCLVYSKAELTALRGNRYQSIFCCHGLGCFLLRLKKEKKIVFDAQHKHKKGYLYDIEITGNFIEIGGHEFSCSIVRDIGAKKVNEELMRQRLSEIELYNSTVKTIRDQIFWIDCNGKDLSA